MIEEKLRVLTPGEAEARHLIRRDSGHSTGPLFVSWGNINLVCGACSYLLMAKLPRGMEMLGSMAIECPNCLTFNGA